jgi:ribosomal protein S18 acetylase RimI-like enzyme
VPACRPGIQESGTLATKDIRPYEPRDRDEVIELSFLAWQPVFDSFRTIMGERIFLGIYNDWRITQAGAVEETVTDPKHATWVSIDHDVVTGFVVYEVRPSTSIGEVHMLAVHPDYQNRGIGTALNHFALERLEEAGMTLAEVGTGGDPGHAPARRSYEKAGYTAVPLIRYYKALGNSDGSRD